MMLDISSGLNWAGARGADHACTEWEAARGLAVRAWSISIGAKPNNRSTEMRCAHRREGGALSPDGAVVADDGGGGEVVALDLAHEVLVDVRLPRHPAASAGGRSVGRSLWW